MGQNDKSSTGFDWAEAQRCYLDALGALGGKTASDPVNPWNKALEYWWQSVEPRVPEGGRSMFSNLLQQSMLFVGLNEQFGKLLSGASAAGNEAADFQAELQRHMDALKSRFEEMAATAIWSPQALMTAMQPGLDTWRRTFSTMSIMPGDVFQVMRQPHGGEEQPQIPPALGYTRELQEEVRTGARLWNEFQKNLLEYQAGLSKVAARAVDRFKERILEMANRGEKISSLRELYNLWIECSEAAYGDQIFTKEYAECYGRMVNSLVAFKNHSQFVVDEFLATMNMPTQQGISTMQRRQQDLRREMRRSAEERRAQGDAIDELRKELEELRAALNAAHRGAPGPGPETSSPGAGGADGTGKKKGADA